jgi:hypothetical protein
LATSSVIDCGVGLLSLPSQAGPQASTSEVLSTQAFSALTVKPARSVCAALTRYEASP